MSEPIKQDAAASSSSGPNIGKLIMVASMFVALAFVVIGAPLPIIQSHQDSGDIFVTVWELQIESPATKTWTVTKLKDVSCDDIKERAKGAQAFSILASVMALFTFIFALLDAVDGCPLVKMGVPMVSVIAAGITFVFTVIQYILVANLWDHGFCGGQALKDAIPKAKLGAGVFLYVVASVVTLVGIIGKIVLGK